MNEKKLKRLASLAIDHDAKKIVATTNDMLWNQLKRDGPAIADSFDSLFSEDIDRLGEVFGQVAGVLMQGLNARSENQKESAIVLQNSLNTFVACIQLFRSGHRLEPLMLIRSIVETVAVVIHLQVHPSDLKKFQNGQLKSTKCITTARKVIPPLGGLYGHLSDTVNHVHDLHRNVNPVIKYKERDEAVSTNFGFLRLSIWLLYITSELTYHNLIKTPMYWVKIEKGYKFDPDSDVQKWMAEFLNRGTSENAS